jgi:hypothetical protein
MGEQARTLISTYGDNMDAQKFLIMELVIDALKAEAREMGTGITGLSGIVAHYVFQDVRRERAE